MVDIDIVQFGTDASLWGGGGVYEGDWVWRRWTAEERRHHINALEALMVLHLVQQMCHQWRGRK
eukprot:1481084-Rhodomonas_salina.1